jgi:hypothetical protein
VSSVSEPALVSDPLGDALGVGPFEQRNHELAADSQAVADLGRSDEAAAADIG